MLSFLEVLSHFYYLSKLDFRVLGATPLRFRLTRFGHFGHFGISLLRSTCTVTFHSLEGVQKHLCDAFPFFKVFRSIFAMLSHFYYLSELDFRFSSSWCEVLIQISVLVGGYIP